ncbi:MAG: FMN-binding protein [Rhodospirillaceae bacterium]|jgi:NosR/NirI family transcriptional regulator, nitrous oxide reductase regulator|nr:FMN-binding protein [Rhodospirillaceae bacterium]MBT5566328.1 FMN-binding protein [Rhodospirillaceae bacterium]MBT6088421.1 FMN-binding protein [Rhodospirillaceae bacterium]MBT6962183.1 FMN-binding protein [Rhodospirillaceae bacterium]MBT7450344.1 FMN-binding protein [Rhodospirillaceae bacterium]
MVPKKRQVITVLVGVVVLLGLVGVQTFMGSPRAEPIEQVTEGEKALLREVFPDADIFSVKSGQLPNHKVYKTDPDTGANTLLGFAFMTHEVEPDEWAYEGPIEILVGVTVGGVITGIKIVDHYEPFGYFSIDPPEFSEQFDNKSILDRFEEGRDIDSVSRATISIESAARVVKKTARRVAKQHLQQEQAKP